MLSRYPLTRAVVVVGFASAPNKKVRKFPVFPARRRSKFDPRLRLLASSFSQRLVVGSVLFVLPSMYAFRSESTDLFFCSQVVLILHATGRR